MSRTSSEREPSTERGRIRSDAAFRSAFVATVVTLAALCLVFLAVSSFQGPKLSEARVDSSLAIAQSGQQLRLFANQQLAEVQPEQVTITPAAPFTVTTSGDLIAVQFESRLFYSAQYEVTIEGVRAPEGAGNSTWSYTFETGSPSLYYLDRADPAVADAPDEIVRTGLSGAEREVVFSAQDIQDFISLEQSLLVVIAQADGTSELSLVSLTEGGSETIPLPEAGTVASLDLLPGTTTVGFEFTSTGEEALRTFDHSLFTIDLLSSRTATPVTGLDGAPLSVLAWHPMPQGATLVAQLRDQTVFLIDPNEQLASLPLGTFMGLGRVSSDGATMGVTDPFGSLVISLDDLSEERVAPSPVDSEVVFGGELQVLASGDRVQQVANLDPVSGRFSSFVVLDDGTESRILYRTVDDAGSIERFLVSPNDQFVAIEVVPRVTEAESDGAAVDPRPVTITTVFVEIATGSVVKTVEGFAPRW